MDILVTVLLIVGMVVLGLLVLRRVGSQRRDRTMGYRDGHYHSGPRARRSRPNGPGVTDRDPAPSPDRSATRRATTARAVTERAARRDGSR